MTAAESVSLLAMAPVALVIGLVTFRRWPVRTLGAAFLSYGWAHAAQAAMNAAAVEFGLWHYAVTPQFLGTPLLMGLGLACLFGPLAFFALKGWRLIAAIALVAMLDAGLFSWVADATLAGSAVRFCLVVAIVASAQFLARATAEDSHVHWRGAMQAVCWSALIFWIFPSAALAQSGESWAMIAHLPIVVALPLALAFVGFLLLGLNAIQEFALRGDGTPFPFDPPKRLVASGAYAYVRNPMQIAICGGLLTLGGLFRDPWIATGAVEAVFLFIVFKHVCAGTSTVKRDDPRAGPYHAAVPAWLPRWRPAFIADAPDLLVAPMDRPITKWMMRKSCNGLRVDAQPGATYRFRSGDGRRESHGLHAIGQALQHVHLAMALIGWLLCLMPAMKATGMRATA